jgi:hypothetical protein
MTVDFKSPVTSPNVNSAYISRKEDSDTVGKIDLKNSGSDDIIDTQATINQNITDIAQNASDISDNASDISDIVTNHIPSEVAHREFDTKVNLETWVLTAPNGAYAFATDEKISYQAIDNVLTAIGVGGGGISEWVSGTTYVVGDQVYYTDNKIYRCIVDNSDITFDPLKWQELSAGVADHNDLINIQGGEPGQYNHLNNNRYDDVKGIRQSINTATATITETTVIIDASLVSVLATLPDASTFWAKTITIWASDLTNTVEIEDASNNIIHTIRTVDSPIQLVTDGTNWIVTDWKGKATNIITEEYKANTAVGTRPSSNSFSVQFSNEVSNTISKSGTIVNDGTDGIVFTASKFCKVEAAGLYANASSTETLGWVLDGNSNVSLNDNSNDGKREARSSNPPGSPNYIARGIVFMSPGQTIKLVGTTNTAVYTGTSNEYQSVWLTVTAYELGTLVKTKRMTYGARIANNGTASIISQTTPSNPAIASVSRISVGRIAVTYTAGFFKEIPSVEATAVNVDMNAGILAGSETINGVTIETRDPASTALDFPVNLLIERQGSDSTDEPIGFVPEFNRTSYERRVGSWFGEPLYEKSYEVGAWTSSIVVDNTIDSSLIIPRDNWSKQGSDWYKVLMTDGTSRTIRAYVDGTGLTFDSNNTVYDDGQNFTIQYTKI